MLGKVWALYTSTAFESTRAHDIFHSSDWIQVLTLSFVLLFQLPSPYLSSAAFSPSFSPTGGKVKLRKKQTNKKPQSNTSGEVFQCLFCLEVCLIVKISLLPLPMGNKILRTLCSQWMKHLAVNHVGINFSVELVCAQGTWLHCLSGLLVHLFRSDSGLVG